MQRNRPNRYTKRTFLEKNFQQENSKKIFFLTYVDLYIKICRIKFREFFRMIVSLPDLSKKNLFEKKRTLKRKNVTFFQKGHSF